MTSIGILRKKVDRLAQQFPQNTLQGPLFEPGYFTDEEEARVLDLIGILPRNTQEWGPLTGNMAAWRFCDFCLLIKLYKALRDGDEERARGYRYRLTFSSEQVIDMYLSLRELDLSGNSLQKYSSHGMLYAVYEERFHNLTWRAHDLGEAWDWLIHAGMVNEIYHRDLEHSVEYKRPSWGKTIR